MHVHKVHATGSTVIFYSELLQNTWSLWLFFLQFFVLIAVWKQMGIKRKYVCVFWSLMEGSFKSKEVQHRVWILGTMSIALLQMLRREFKLRSLTCLEVVHLLFCLSSAQSHNCTHLLHFFLWPTSQRSGWASSRNEERQHFLPGSLCLCSASLQTPKPELCFRALGGHMYLYLNLEVTETVIPPPTAFLSFFHLLLYSIYFPWQRSFSLSMRLFSHFLQACVHADSSCMLLEAVGRVATHASPSLALRMMVLFSSGVIPLQLTQNFSLYIADFLGKGSSQTFKLFRNIFSHFLVNYQILF